MRQLMYMPKMFGQPLYPDGMPLYFGNSQWKGDIKEKLEAAVYKYHGVFIGGSQDLTDEDRNLLFEYVVYHINAPIWSCNRYAKPEDLKRLRDLADSITTIEMLENYLMEALEMGLDPI